MIQDKALTIYKASAGSGKTFTLAVKYIELLINNPMSFKSTLAVTFTNKATEEMKTRILSQLYGIWKQLPDSKDYIDRIKKDLGVTELFMSERARIALLNIIHNYSYFRIETIDSFFQSVLRNLARELDLTANLRIELNDRQIESIAVDELIDSLGEKDELLKWILGYIKENIDDDKNWNVVGYIKSFGENIFKEFYKTKSKELNELIHRKGFFEAYTRQLRQIRDDAEKTLSDSAARFFEALQTEGLSIEDLSYGKSGPAAYFIKIQNGQYDDSIITGRVKKALEEGSADNWTKKAATAEVRDFAASTLVPLLAETEKTRLANWKMYGSALLTLKHLNQLRLLNSIEGKVREMNAEANRFLLSDTHTLLHSLIKDTDSPFIFEKIGTRLENVMIDEFQDTSTIQWQNFKVLLEECMSRSEEQGNLIVGDVKQSIYRWRSGDWRMLNNIEAEFPYMRDELGFSPLKDNYRSTHHVINFNNAFFIKAAELECAAIEDGSENGEELAALLRKAYADVEQDIPEKNKKTGGYVRIDLLPGDDYTENALSMVVETVDDLLSHGAKPSDIAIIVRSNSTIQQIAEHFSQTRPDIKIVSDEAFRLDNSTVLNIITAAMHCLSHKEDKLTRAFIAKAYQTKVKGVGIEEVNRMISTEEGINNALPQDYITHSENLLAMPIYELAERLYTLFNLETIKGEDAYIYAFFDCLTDFLTNNTACLDDFLEEWNETFSAKTIQAKDIDGIRLITIHKSKGLEFKHLIVPFCDWRMEKVNTIWCQPTEAPFNELPLVPVDFSAKQMTGTIYEHDYAEEHLQNCVDNLNLLYVAFTRAKESLFVIARRGNASLRSNIIENVITDKEFSLNETCTVEESNDSITFTYGELDIAPKEDKKSEKNESKEENVFICEKIDKIEMEMQTFENKAEFKQSNKSQEFINGTDDDGDEQQQSYIKTGLLLHYLFSNIKTTDDIDNCLTDMEMEGLFDESVITADKLKTMLHKRFENPTVKDWFSDKWTLFNECTILEHDANTDKVKEHRPDRVMKCGDKVVVVDFKFGKPQPEYTEQIQRYTSLINCMGYTDVRGYLWYVYSGRIEEVKNAN